MLIQFSIYIFKLLYYNMTNKIYRIYIYFNINYISMLLYKYINVYCYIEIIKPCICVFPII